MGCCTSAAVDYSNPTKKGQITTSSNKQQTDNDISNQQGLEEEQFQQEQNQEQGIQSKVSKRPPPPCKYPRPDDQKNENYQVPKPKPKIETVLTKLIRFGRDVQDNIKQSSEQEKQLIVEIQDKIFDQSLEISHLNAMCNLHQKSLSDILFLKGCQGLTLLEEILIYIDNFVIITQLLLENLFPGGDDLFYLTKRLVTKILPVGKQMQQIKLAINFIKILKESKQVAIMLQEANLIFLAKKFQDLELWFDLKNKYHIKLLKQLVKLFEHYQIKSSLMRIYEEAKRYQIFTTYKIPKIIPIGESEVSGINIILLEELQFNIFHQIALENRWDQFHQYSNAYYQQPNTSGLTPFMIMFQKAPLSQIVEYLTKYPKQLQQAIHYSTQQGMNILHCFCMNKHLTVESEESVHQIITALNSLPIKQLLLQPYQEQIPLVYYLDSQKIVLNEMCEFLSQNIEKQFNTFEFMVKSIMYTEEMKMQKLKFHKQSLCQLLRQKENLTRKEKTFLETNELKGDYSQQETLYFHYIQLVKLLIKRNFDISFPWVNKYNIYTCKFPYECGTVQQTFMNILIRNGLVEQVKFTILQMNKEFNYENNEELTFKGFSYKAQLIAKLICLKKELKLFPYQQIDDLLDSIIIQSISEDPKLLLKPLYGALDFKSMKSNSIYSLLLQLNDTKLNQSCFTVQLLFEITNETALLILNQVIALKQQHSQDHVLKKVIDIVPNKGVASLKKYYRVNVKIKFPKEGDLEDDKFYIGAQQILNLIKQQQNMHIEDELMQQEDQGIDHTINFNYYAIKELSHNFESQKTLMIVLKNKKDQQRLLSKIWHLGVNLQFIPKILLDQVIILDKKITIFSVRIELYEDLFDWQLAGIQFRIISKRVSIDQTMSQKQLVIATQLKQDTSFINSLVQFKQFHKEVKQYYTLFPQYTKDVLMNDTLRLREILYGNALENLEIIIQELKLSKIGLIEYLTYQYFSSPTLQAFKYHKNNLDLSSNKQVVDDFNTQILMLININIDMATNLDFHPRKYNIEQHLSYFYPETYQKFDQQLKNQLYEFSRLSKVIENCQNHKLKLIIISDFYEKKKQTQELANFLQILWQPLVKDIALNEFLISKFVKDATQSQMNQQYLFRLFLELYNHKESVALQYLHQIEFSENNILTLFCQSLKKQSELALNQLLIYSEQHEIQLKQILKMPILCKEEIQNYYKSMEHPYYLVLSLKQYQSILVAQQIKKEITITHLRAFIKHGLYEKMQLIIDNHNFEDYCQMLFQTQKRYLTQQLHVTFEENNRNEHENDAINEVSKELLLFFDFHQFSRARKQINYKKNQRELQNEEMMKKMPKQLNNTLKKNLYIKECSKDIKQLSFQQNFVYSKQNDNTSSIFMSTGGQKIDYEKCFSLIQKKINLSKLKQKEVSGTFELYNQLLFPDGKQISQSQLLINLLVEIFMKAQKPNKFIQSRYDGYLKLFKSNSGLKNLSISEELSRKVTPFQKAFRLEALLALKNESKEEISNLILKEQHQDIRCVKYLADHLIQMENLQFNATTLFYSKQKVNLLKQKEYDLSNNSSLTKRLEFIKLYMSATEFDASKITPTQVLLYKGREDHILSKISFSQNNLIAAMLSNKLSTIMYVMNLHQNPKVLGFEQNIFQILLMLQCQQNLITYYNTYIKGFVKDFSRFLVLNNIPTLYYVIYKKQERVFKEIILQSLATQFGSEKANTIIKSELQKPTVLTEYKVYQIGIMMKSYFILNYLEGIIQPDDIELITTSMILQDLKANIILQDQNSKELQFYTIFQQSLPLCFQPQVNMIMIKKKQKKEKSKAKQKQKLKQHQKQIQKIEYSYLQEVLNLEKICLCKIFGLKITILLKSQALQTTLEEDKWQILSKYKFTPQLLQIVMGTYREKNGTYNISKDLMEKIILNLLDATIIHEQIYCDLISLNPTLVLQYIKPIQVTLEIATLFYILLKQQPEFLIFVQTHQLKYKDYIRIPEQNSPIEGEVIEQEEENPIPLMYMSPSVVYILVLLQNISVDTYEKNFLSQNFISVALLQREHELLSQYSKKGDMIQDLLSEKSIDFLKSFSSLSLQFQDNSIFQIMLQNEKTREGAVIKCLIYIKQIESIIINITEQMNREITTSHIKNTIKPKFQIDFGNENVFYQDHIVQLTLEFKNDGFALTQNKIDLVLAQIHLQNQFTKHENQLTKWNEMQQKQINKVIDLSSIASLQLGDSSFEDCFQQVNVLTQLLNYVGQYQIDDIFAPHQHETVRQPELTQQVSLQKQPSLQRQSSSVISALPLIKSTSINNRQKMKEDYQFMLELLPDNTYQVRQRNQKTNQKQLVFPEFYFYVQPKMKLNFIKLTKEEFEIQYDWRSIMSILISDLYKYNEFIGNEIEGKQQEEWIVNFPYFIHRNEIMMQRCLFSTFHIQYVYQRLFDYSESVRIFVEPDEAQKLVWRINATSFMEVFVSKLVVEFTSKQIQFIDIYSLMNLILNWPNFKMILNTLIYHNLTQAQQVLKVIRGLYIEFNEVQDLIPVEIDNPNILDKIFQFGNTTYLLNNHILIIRINVQMFSLPNMELALSKRTTSLLHDPTTQQYFHNILNIYDFYNQILTPDQLITFIFNKLEIDRELLQFSNQLSKEFKKTITLSVDHISLINIFSGEIQRAIQNRKDEIRLKELEQIWYLLNKLRMYFKTDLLQCLVQQLRSGLFEEMFNIRLFCLLYSLRTNIPLYQIITSNTRKLETKHNTQIIQKICNITKKTLVNLAHYFGFQLIKSYYVNNNKLGDVCVVCYYEDQHIHSITGQLVCNSKTGQFIFAKLCSFYDKLLTIQLINRNQGFYSQIKSSNKEFALMQIEDIYTILLLQPSWPSDSMFNQCILNVYFIDQDGNLSICNEKKLQTSMIEIQNEQDEQRKQELLDNLLGVGLASAYSDITLTQMTPIFPDSINFDFTSMNSLKKQQSLISGRNVSIIIDQDQFIMNQIEVQKVSFACYFEANLKAQVLQIQFIEFFNRHSELNDVYLVFDDSMNQDENNVLGRLISSFNFIFGSFEKGYEDFIFEKVYPKIQHSLQYLFGISSIKQIKTEIIAKLISKIDFVFTREFSEQQPLLHLKDNILRIYTFVTDDAIISPTSEEICSYLNNLMVNQIENQQHQNSKQVTKISSQIENMQTVIDIILISQYLSKLILILDRDIVVIINIRTLQEIERDKRFQIYSFQGKEEININSSIFSDFSITQFVLDYLNAQIHHVKEKQNLLIQYQGPEILFENLQLKQDQLFSGIENFESQLQLILDDQVLQQEISYLDPNEFSQAIILLKVEGFYNQLVVLKSFKDDHLQKFNCQSLTSQYSLGDSVYLLINQLKSNQPLDVQLNKIKLKLHFGIENRKTYQLGQLMLGDQQSSHLLVKGSFITNNDVLLQIASDKQVKISVISPIQQISLAKNQLSKSVYFQFNTQLVQDLYQTQHLYVSYRNQQVKIELEKNDQITFGKGNAQLMKILMREVKTRNLDSFIYKSVEPITHSKDLQAGNTINILSNNDAAAATRAGEKRSDYLEFHDTLGNTIQNYCYENIVFVHSLYYQIQYVPQQERAEEGLKLIWTPTFKGVYKLFIDDIQIRGRFIILADIPDIQTSFIEMPKDLETIPFYEMIHFSFIVKDKFDNCYSDTDSQVYSDLKCEVVKVQSNQTNMNSTFSNLSKIGQLNVQVVFEPDDVTVLEGNVAIEFVINHQLKKGLALVIKGICLDKRRNKFLEEVSKFWKPKSHSLNISRMNFLQDLLELAEEKLNYSFHIKFHNEPGIDAGGLKREFYDMIGNTLKDETYKFFTPVAANQSKYFLNYRFNKMKNKEQYALLFGKLIANAIANTYLIGIDIIGPFWKVVFNQQIVFEDLKYIWDEPTYKNYEAMKNMSAEEIESICLDFTYQIGNLQVDLVQNGSKISVGKKNLDLYLNKTAEYLISKQFASIYKSFIEGFQSVLDIQICQKWIRPGEMSLLTQGLLEIQSEVVLQKLNFSGGKPQHKSYFETYISQADSQTLKNMLKFITGSSSIPFDQSSYVIGVQFRNNLDERKLPLSHTCFKTIEVPLYKTYAQLKQKLDIAFTIGMEGYGFG